MIADARALRDDWLPNALKHRHSELDSLSTALRERNRSCGYRPVWIDGPSGTGKTTLARYISKRLEKESTDVRTGEVNCMSEGTSTSVLYNLLRSADLGQAVPLETSRARLLEEFRDYDNHLIAIVDEVDQIADASLLCKLYEMGHVSPVLVCIDRDRWLSKTDQRVQSRFATVPSVSLERYDQESMVDILSARVDVGLAPRSITDDAVEAIADESAGDARFGINLLRLCAERCQDEGRDIIEAELVADCAPNARSVVTQRYVSQLSTHPRLLYEIVAEAGEISASELHQQYERQATDPKGRRQRRRYLEALEEKYELVQSRGTTSAKRYAVGS